MSCASPLTTLGAGCLSGLAPIWAGTLGAPGILGGLAACMPGKRPGEWPGKWPGNGRVNGRVNGQVMAGLMALRPLLVRAARAARAARAVRPFVLKQVRTSA